MQVSPNIRKKMAFLVGDLICRCIHDARMIPYILHQEEVINILIDDPPLFEKLVQNEQAFQMEYSKKSLTANFDAISELKKAETLDTFNKLLGIESPGNLSPNLDLINQLTRTFAVYISNAHALFDKSFEEFMDKFRQWLQGAGMTLRKIEFTLEDVEVLKKNAESFLSAREFLQAFAYDRLLNSQATIREIIDFPAHRFSLSEDLIRCALKDSVLATALVKFVIRVSYLSQGTWSDLFSTLVKLVHQDIGLCSRKQLVELIEHDVIFSCNLLCMSIAELKNLPSSGRRSAIEQSLEKIKGEAGFMLVSRDP